jgi:hypothetical protein
MILIASVISLRHFVKDAHNHRIMSKSKKNFEPSQPNERFGLPARIRQAAASEQTSGVTECFGIPQPHQKTSSGQF